VCTVPITIEEKQTLETRMGFKFRQVMGEVMFPMVKCRPDISPHVIYLSQFLDNPGEMHYNALRHICQYLAATTTWGMAIAKFSTCWAILLTRLCHGDDFLPI
jgi:hypothetical protein